MKFAILTAFILLSTGSIDAATVDTIHIFSNSMHKQVTCVVIEPASYNKNNALYPVLYLLHGYSGNYADWVKKVPDLLQDVDEANMLIVCPDGAFGSWYFDSPVDSSIKYETDVAIEIPAYIDSHYRTVKDRKGRAITGLSMGGHGGLYLGIRHKDFFGAAGSMSGGVDIRPFPENWDLAKDLGDYANHKANWDSHTVMTIADDLKDGDLAIVFECGVDDFFIDVNRKLHQKLVDKKIAHDYTERPGAHDWNYWGNAIKYQLLFFKNYFATQQAVVKPA